MQEPRPTFDVIDTSAIQVRIDITQPQAVDYWLGTLGVDEHHLRTAVAEVGTSAQDVRCYLGIP
ncbi:DUF3606 domain-containing protein [Variovorax sp. LT1P1]|uniref:DUF3606 domain-containing protein n=1 Tax=Variovorax sp. LT1P1 TaxID=3443730 RepID=UPI003F478685